jgi:predicted RNase H-like HicB family nuclease
MTLRFYRVIAYQGPREAPDDGWDVIFPEFPGCVSEGETEQLAMENAVEALAQHIDAMVAASEPLPAAVGVNAPLPDWILATEMPNQVHALLPMEVPGKTVRINFTMDEALVNRLDAVASREGTTRSGYLSQAVREKLQRSRQLT